MTLMPYPERDQRIILDHKVSYDFLVILWERQVLGVNWLSESEEFGVLMKGEDVTNFTRIIRNRDCYCSTPSELYFTTKKSFLFEPILLFAFVFPSRSPVVIPVR